MPAPNYRSSLIESQGDGTAVTLVAEASLLPAQAKLTLPANYIYRVGQRFQVKAKGRISNVVTTPGTLTIRLKFGAIIVAASKAIPLNIVAKTNVGWDLAWDLVIRSIGAGTGATFMHNGVWTSESVVGTPAGAAGGAILQDAPAVGTGFDSTIANVIDLAAIFSITGNSMLCHQYAFESTN